MATTAEVDGRGPTDAEAPGAMLEELDGLAGAPVPVVGAHAAATRSSASAAPTQRDVA